jgi:ketosteroid isomerase-like protein
VDLYPGAPHAQTGLHPGIAHLMSQTMSHAPLHPALLALSLPLLAASGQACAGDVEDLIEIDKRQQRAYIDRDWATLEQILSDDYVLVVSNGAEYDRKTVIAESSDEGKRWEINETSDWSVRVWGDSAVLVATLYQKGVRDGKPFEYRVRFSDTYVRSNGTWRNVHAHSSGPLASTFVAP